MVDDKILKAQAKSQLDVLAMFLICGVIFGALFEYHHATTPLVETMLVYQSGHQANVVSEPVVDAQPEQPAAEQPAAEQPAPESNEPEVNNNSLSEFLTYMHQVQEDIARLEPEASVLEKINVTVVPAEQPENKPAENVENPAQASEEKETAPVDEVINATEEISATIDAEKQAAEEITEAMRERVTAEIDEIQAEGEEKPIVLIPGMMAESNQPENEAQE